MKTDPPILITADFEYMNAPLESAKESDSMDKFFVYKPVASGYIKKNSDNDDVKRRKEGYNKLFGESCDDWFVNRMLEREAYILKKFKLYIELNPETKLHVLQTLTL